MVNEGSRRESTAKAKLRTIILEETNSTIERTFREFTRKLSETT